MHDIVLWPTPSISVVGQTIDPQEAHTAAVAAEYMSIIRSAMADQVNPAAY